MELPSQFSSESALTPAAQRSQAVDFSPVFGVCDAHGEFALNVLDDEGRVRWYPDGCQKCRRQKMAEAILDQSGIQKRFIGCTFENFEAPTAAKKDVLNRCKAYAESFSTHRENGACLILCGNRGTGKNHLSTAVARHVLNYGYSVLQIKAAQYLDAYWAKSFDEREAWVRDLAGVDLLMIDEAGRSSSGKAAQDAFFRLIDARYEAVLPMLLTTNLSREGLIGFLGDAAYDRLTQGGGVRLTLDWGSYRSEI